MPSVSDKQHRLMEAVKHGWKKPGGGGPSKAVASEFVAADKAAGKYAAGGEVARPTIQTKPRIHEESPYDVLHEDQRHFLVRHKANPEHVFRVAKFGLGHKTLTHIRSNMKPGTAVAPMAHLDEGGTAGEDGYVKPGELHPEVGATREKRLAEFRAEHQPANAPPAHIMPEGGYSDQSDGPFTGTHSDAVARVTAGQSPAPAEQNWGDAGATAGLMSGTHAASMDGANVYPDQNKLMNADPNNPAPPPAPPEKQLGVPGYNGMGDLNRATKDYDAGQQMLVDQANKLGASQEAAQKWFIDQHAAVAAQAQEKRIVLEKQLNDTVDAIKNFKIDPERHWGTGGTGVFNRLKAGIGLILSGAGAGMTGQPNLAMAAIEKAIDRDIDAQKTDLANKNSMVNVYFRQLGNLDQAETRAKLDLHTALQAKLDLALAQAKGPTQQANAQIAMAANLQRIVQLKDGLVNSQVERQLKGIQIQAGQMQLQQQKEMMSFLKNVQGHGEAGGGMSGETLMQLEMNPMFKGYAERWARNPYDGKFYMAGTKERADSINKAVSEEMPYVHDLKILHQKMREISTLQANNPLSAQRREVLGREVQAIMGQPRFTEMVNRFTGNEEKLARSLFNDWQVPGMREGVLRNIESLIGTSKERMNAVMRQNYLNSSVPGVSDAESMNPTALKLKRAGE